MQQFPALVYGLPNHRHALIAAGRVHSVLATEETDARFSAFETQARQVLGMQAAWCTHRSSESQPEPPTQGIGRNVLTMVHAWGSAKNGRRVE